MKRKYDPDAFHPVTSPAMAFAYANGQEARSHAVVFL
jgi:hypothetical protein